MPISKDIKTLSENCGLPSEWATEQLADLVRQSGRDPETVNLHELREILAAFLQDVILVAKDELSGDQEPMPWP